MQQTGLVSDPQVKQHDTGPGHPEHAGRISAVMNRLNSSGLTRNLTNITPRKASEEELLLVHTRSYLDLVDREVSQHRPHLSTGDTDISPGSAEAARRAAGCALAAVDAVFTKEVRNAFCVVRPPGHHASQARGMGFCLFNNVAVAARYAQQKYSVERVVIVDWDVHHGNGTQDVFYRDGSVLFFSTHQSPWYPGTGDSDETGEGRGEGKIINCPFPAGSGRAEIGGSFRERLIPAVEQFGADLILISAGFDSRINDPLGHFLLTDEDFGEMTGQLMDLAERHCSGRLVSLLEGGYNLDGLGLAAEAHVRALTGGV